MYTQSVSWSLLGAYHRSIANRLIEIRKIEKNTVNVTIHGQSLTDVKHIYLNKMFQLTKKGILIRKKNIWQYPRK